MHFPVLFFFSSGSLVFHPQRSLFPPAKRLRHLRSMTAMESVQKWFHFRALLTG